MTKNIHKDHASKQKRFPLIDYTRGFAVLLMIIFHFSYDLSAFNFVHIDFQRDLFWWIFPRVIVFFFLYAMGQSLELVHQNSIQIKKVGKRFAKIGFFALCISTFTYFAFPKNWIYFGTLHCIALSSVLVLPFVGRPKLTALASALMLVPLLWGFQLPWFKLGHASMDYIPLFPWIGVVFLGQFSTHLGLHRYGPNSTSLKSLLLPLELMGRHSLLIYLIHQPVLFGLVKLYHVATY